MSKKGKIILISIFAALVVVAGAVLIWRRATSPDNDKNQNSQTAVGQAVQNSGFKTYTHPGYGFSFEYPDGWNVSSFSEGEGETILIQNNQTPSNNNQAGVQIYISIFDEPENSLTKERILEDLPDLKITNDKQIKIAGLPAGEAGSIGALSFDSENESGQKTREVWFVHNSFLYQISAAGNGGVLDKIINTFKFN